MFSVIHSLDKTPLTHCSLVLNQCETSHLIYNANQKTTFHMKCNTVQKWIKLLNTVTPLQNITKINKSFVYRTFSKTFFMQSWLRKIWLGPSSCETNQFGKAFTWQIFWKKFKRKHCLSGILFYILVWMNARHCVHD